MQDIYTWKEEKNCTPLVSVLSWVPLRNVTSSYYQVSIGVIGFKIYLKRYRQKRSSKKELSSGRQ